MEIYTVGNKVKCKCGCGTTGTIVGPSLQQGYYEVLEPDGNIVTMYKPILVSK